MIHSVYSCARFEPAEHPHLTIPPGLYNKDDMATLSDQRAVPLGLRLYITPGPALISSVKWLVDCVSRFYDLELRTLGNITTAFVHGYCP